MKDLQGTASATARATPEQALDLLADVSGYPGWYPDVVRRVEVLERGPDGGPQRARARLHAAVGPVARDLELVLDVTREDPTVRLTRVPHEPGDRERFEVVWQVNGTREGGARIDLTLLASLDVPRLVPLGGVGDTMAGGFVAAAVRALDGAG